MDAGDFRSVARRGGRVTAPMPGSIVAVQVAVGDSVKTGQALVVLEAMKMEHVIGAPGDGEVTDLNVVTGDAVEEGAELVVLK